MHKTRKIQTTYKIKIINATYKIIVQNVTTTFQDAGIQFSCLLHEIHAIFYKFGDDGTYNHAWEGDIFGLRVQ